MTEVKHPSKFSNVLLPVMAQMLESRRHILDPFAGTGKIFEIQKFLPEATIDAIEIEPEWAALDSRITLGDALSLPWEDDTFDAICTSPTYGNRMADHFVTSNPNRVAKSYRGSLQRDLHPHNSGRMQWGKRYRKFHEEAWAEAVRCLCDGGSFVLNIKDHIRYGERQNVTAWHQQALEWLGLRAVEHRHVATPSHRFGANREARVPYESVIHFVLE